MTTIAFKTWRHLGDHTTITAVLHNASLMYPDVKFTVDPVDRSLGYQDLYINNPYYTDTSKYDYWVGIEYGLDDRGQERTAKYGTLIDGCTRTGIFSLEKKLGKGIEIQPLRTAEFFLTEDEKHKYDYLGDYVVINAGFQSTYSTKAYPYYQDIVDRCPGVNFIQMGGTKQDDNHRPLQGVTPLIGETSVRDLVCLIYGSKALVSPPSGCVNVASAFPHVHVFCIIGGREPERLLKYPNVTLFTSTICMDNGITRGCMARRCKHNITVGDTQYPRCMCDVDSASVASSITKVLGVYTN